MWGRNAEVLIEQKGWEGRICKGCAPERVGILEVGKDDMSVQVAVKLAVNDGDIVNALLLKVIATMVTTLAMASSTQDEEAMKLVRKEYHNSDAEAIEEEN